MSAAAAALGMGKRALLSPKTRANQLQLRADEVERNQKRKELFLAIKNWPRVILPLHGKLQSLGVPMDKLHEVDPNAVLSKQAQHNVRMARQGSSGSLAGSSSDPAPENAGDGRVVQVPQRARLLCELSTSLIRDHLLAKLQPSILSSRNLKSIVTGELSTQQGLLRLLEFVTGINPNTFDITSEMRTMPSLVARLKVHMAARCDRMLPLASSLEVDWTAIGLIKVVEQSESAVSLVHNYSWK